MPRRNGLGTKYLKLTMLHNIEDFDIYAEQLKNRLEPSVAVIQGINSQIKKNQKKVVFADGEDENNLKAAIAFKNNGLGEPILIAKEDIVKKKLYEIGYEEKLDIKIINSTDTKLRERYVKFLFENLPYFSKEETEK